ncbi:MAG: hypothetical protein AAB601_02080 [Patescibacteria group bacterium]
MTIEIIVFGGIALVLMSGFVLWTFSALNFSLRTFNKSLAFSVAEAGIEYYRWHLAHNQSDYWDGQGATSTGPYVHEYYDRFGNFLGEFALVITPPPQASTIVTIESRGTVAGDPTVEKIIRVKLGIPSFSKSAVATNADMRFGEGTDIYGEIVSNGGLRFDGTAHNVVKSARYTYDDPDHTGGYEFGVHTHRNKPPQTGVNNSFRPDESTSTRTTPEDRPDVFLAGRELSVPTIDFVGLTQDLANIRAQASSSGVYATSSGAQGFELVFNVTSSYTIYRVTSLQPVPRSSCSNSQGQAGWGTWSVQNRTLFKSGPMPTSGLFFFEDHVWVRGKVSSSRATVGSGRFPVSSSTWTSITLNNDLLYSNYDGKDALQLIAQNNVNIGLFSEDDLRIDAALIAQNGRVGRYYYRPPGWYGQGCSPNHVRQKITSYGTIATYLRYGFAYTDSTGYQIRELVYDSNLLYSPPPAAPQTGEHYEQVSWEEVR